MRLRLAFISTVAISVLHMSGSALAASWSEVLCGAVTKSPLCAPFNSGGQTTEDERIKRIKLFYLAKLDKWVLNPDPNTAQDQVVSGCGVLTIISATPDAAGNFLKGEEREEFDARVDACTKLTAHRAWPQPDFAKPQTIDLVCNRWTPLLRELCIRASLKA